jgi:hypothetical protein
MRVTPHATSIRIHHFYYDDEKTFIFFFLVYLTQLEKNELHLKEEKNMFNWSSIDLF